MLSNTLVTNEIKNRSGTEVEFQRLSIGDRKTVFAPVADNPALPIRLTISHLESGNALTRRRRGLVRFDKTVVSTVDNVTPVTVSAYVVLDCPIGALTTTNDAADALAYLMSFCASLGASTTILYDGSGNGATALLTGGV